MVYCHFCHTVERTKGRDIEDCRIDRQFQELGDTKSKMFASGLSDLAIYKKKSEVFHLTKLWLISLRIILKFFLQVA